jgi:uncharacterized protein YggE
MKEKHPHERQGSAFAGRHNRRMSHQDKEITMQAFRSTLLAAAMVAGFAGFAAAAPATLTVTGEGRVAQAPDMASVSLGVTTEGKTAAEALAANSTALAAVMARLTQAGIAPGDLQTSGLSLNPNWQNDSSTGGSRISGYIASNMLTVRVRALDGLGNVLDAAVKDGANTLNGVNFGLADPSPVEAEARKRAVADAKARAAVLAEAAGVTLGPIVTITEGGGGGNYPAPMFRMAAEAAPVPMAGGEVETAMQVTIVWEIGQ